MPQIYVSYQCTVCRKTKDIVDDPKRALPNLCTITPGCSGRLLFAGEKSGTDIYSPSAKLVNGANDRLEKVIPVDQQESILLSTSNFGSLTLAVKWSGTIPHAINLKVTQRKAYDVQYQQYVYKTTQSTTSLNSSSRDIGGKFLRFDSTAISENRVVVTVNGVVRTIGGGSTQISLTPNTITFNTPVSTSSTISVVVYSEQVTVEKMLAFDLNSVKLNTENRFGSWSNIGKLSIRPQQFPTEVWYLYSCTFLSDLSYSSKVKIESITDASNNVLLSGLGLADAKFVLASSPYTRVDRIYNFVVGTDVLSSGYLLSTTSSGFVELSFEKELATEIYPPIEIKNSRGDYIIADDYTEASIPTSVGSTLSSSKIIGPI